VHDYGSPCNKFLIYYKNIKSGSSRTGSYCRARINEPHICEAHSRESLVPLCRLISSLLGAVLNFCFTHAKHPDRGARRLVMKWGIKKADELDLPSYVEATDIGLKLYQPPNSK
jgi:hypothetical protein